MESGKLPSVQCKNCSFKLNRQSKDILVLYSYPGISSFVRGTNVMAQFPQ